MSQSFDETSDLLHDGAPEGASDLEQDVEVAEVEAGLAAADPEDAPDEPLAGLDVEPEVEDVDVVDPEADAVVAEAEDALSAEPDPMAEFLADLHAKPGDWYVVHTYSGMEKRVKTNLENRINSLNMEDFIHEVVVPTEEYSEVKNGQIKKGQRTTLPGYVLVRMDLTDESWSAVRHTPSVTGFVGHAHQPVPLSLTEVENMLAPAVAAQVAAAASAAAEPGTPESQPKAPKLEFTDFGVSDSVMVIDGPFATLHATITEINSVLQE